MSDSHTTFNVDVSPEMQLYKVLQKQLSSEAQKSSVFNVRKLRIET